MNVDAGCGKADDKLDCWLEFEGVGRVGKVGKGNM